MRSDLHTELANRALVWLAWRATGAGIRGTTEVPLARDYVADAVALAAFQWRFHQAYFTDARWAGHWEVSACVFEVKVSRADFLATFGKGKRHANRQRPVGTLHWCVVARPLELAELPAWWGILRHVGNGLREERRPIPQWQPPRVIHRIAHDILWRAANDRSALCRKLMLTEEEAE